MGSKQNRQSRRWRTFITTATAAQEQRYTLIRQCVQYCIPVCVVLHTNVCSIAYQFIPVSVCSISYQCVQYFIPACAVFHTSSYQCVLYFISVCSISYQFIPVCTVFHTSSYHCVQYFIPVHTTVCSILSVCAVFYTSVSSIFFSVTMIWLSVKFFFIPFEGKRL